MANMCLWDGLLTRLKMIAHNKGQCDGATIIRVTLYFKDGELVGWKRPEREPLEPKQFPFTILPKDSYNG
jgi:hypothetical protein